MGYDKFYGHISYNIGAYIMHISMVFHGNFNWFWASSISEGFGYQEYPSAM